jgi:hypothetical protein
MLERLEIELRTKKSEDTPVSPQLQIEHVLPQRWGAHWPLSGKLVPANVVSYPHLATDELADLAEGIRSRNTHLHTLGNLTLLNKYLNPAASNGDFSMKLVEYKHSVLRLNRYFDNQKKWDEEEIRKRGKLLGELLCKIWPRPDAVY